ncbi:MAG: hypothetical protein M5U34_46355 [Chloroflexi bacterium]|nr:hypothetical protein [Chloroflexota bacterium]
MKPVTPAWRKPAKQRRLRQRPPPNPAAKPLIIIGAVILALILSCGVFAVPLQPLEKPNRPGNSGKGVCSIGIEALVPVEREALAR